MGYIVNIHFVNVKKVQEFFNLRKKKRLIKTASNLLARLKVNKEIGKWFDYLFYGSINKWKKSSILKQVLFSNNFGDLYNNHVYDFKGSKI